jgi:dTDP-4-amino-4,6-dideoxygalactose transaminase
MTKTNYRVPFNRPSFSTQDLVYLGDALRSGHAAGDGSFTARCHALLEEILGVRRALLTTNCTHALEMSALLLNLGPGDEVIMPSFTFVSTANAFVLRGARPVFVDIRPDTLNIDERLIERHITPKTRAIVVVHYAGVGCEMDAILDIAVRHELVVIEDNAHGLFGRYRGKFLGTFGQLATQSFHETKNFTCGEGGALLINDDRYITPGEIIREKGTNRSRFFRGQVDKYTWVGLGSSYLPADLLAAVLLSQLESRERIQSIRRRIFTWYEETLMDWATAHGVGMPYVPAHCEQAYHMFYLLLPSVAERQRLIAHLRERGILAVFHYLPLHLSEMGKSLGGSLGDCPVTEDVSDRILRLPFFNDLTRDDLAYVTEAILAFEP